jgi:hypothetical protein
MWFPRNYYLKVTTSVASIDLSSFSFIVVHVETYNVAKSHSVAFMCSAYRDLVNYLRSRAPGIRIINP